MTRHATQPEYRENEIRQWVNAIAWILWALVCVLLCALAVLNEGCVSQTVTINSRGAVILDMRAEKPVNVNPQTTGVPGL